jgi:hypothetical protein
MAEREISQPTTSRSSQKSCWLTALDELEKEFLAFQRRRRGEDTVHSDVTACSALRPVTGPDFRS